MNLLPKLFETMQANSGLHPDLHPKENYLWKNGENVHFTNTGVRKDLGWEVQYTQSAGSPHATYPRGMVARITASTEELHFGNDTKLFVWNGGSLVTDALNFTGNKHLWSMIAWGNWILATNGKDAPVIYKGSSYANLGGSPPSTVEVFLVDHAHVLAFNTSVAYNEFAWCHEDDVETWTPTSTNAAGSLVIREFSSPIVAAVKLGENIAVYSGKQLAIVRYLGAPLYYGYDVKIHEGISVYNKKSVITVGGQNYGLGEDGFFVTNGIEKEALGDGDILDTFFGELNQNATGVINGFHNSETDEVIWYYPTGSNTEPTKGISYNYKTGQFSFKGYGRYASMASKADGASSMFNTPMAFAPPDDSVTQFWNLVSHNKGNNADARPLNAFIQSKPIPFNSESGSLEDYEKYVEAVKFYLSNYNAEALIVKIGVQDNLDDDIFYFDLVHSEDPTIPVFPEVVGRWITVRLESNEVDATWEVQGFAIHGRVVGGTPK